MKQTMESKEEFLYRAGREDALCLIHSSLLEHRRYEEVIVNLLRSNAERHLIYPGANYTNPHYTAGIVSVLVEALNQEPYDGVPADTGSV